jgi:hypothetical protein
VIIKLISAVKRFVIFIIWRRSARTNEESGDDGSEPRNLSQPEMEVAGNQREETTSGVPAAQQDLVQMLLNFFLL